MYVTALHLSGCDSFITRLSLNQAGANTIISSSAPLRQERLLKIIVCYGCCRLFIVKPTQEFGLPAALKSQPPACCCRMDCRFRLFVDVRPIAGVFLFMIQRVHGYLKVFRRSSKIHNTIQISDYSQTRPGRKGDEGYRKS